MERPISYDEDHGRRTTAVPTWVARVGFRGANMEHDNKLLET